MDACVICKKPFEKRKKGKEKVSCVFCEKLYHADCANMAEDDLEIYTTKRHFKWACEDCEGQGVINMLLDKVNKLENKCENIERIASENNDANALFEEKMQENNACLLREIGNLMTQRMDGSEKLMAEMSTVMRKQSSYSDILRGAVEQTQQVRGHSLNTPKSKRPWSAMSTATDSDIPTQSQPAKRKKDESVLRKKDPIVICRSKDEGNKAELKRIVRGTVNPLNDPVKYYRETARGDLIIHCNDHSSVDVIKSKLNTVAGKIADVSEPKIYDPIVRIAGFDAEFKENGKLIDALCKQNPALFDSNSRLEVIENIKRANSRCYARIKVDMNTFDKLMRNQRVAIGWDRCIVNEYINLWRCHRCQAYGHAQASCTCTEPVCGRCSVVGHTSDDCISEALKCVNCTKANNELNMNNPVDHCVWSNKCVVLQRRLTQRQKTIRYNDA